MTLHLYPNGHMPASIPLSPADAERLRTFFSKAGWAESINRPYALFAFRVRGETLGWAYYPKKKVLVEEGKAGVQGERVRAEMSVQFPAITTAEGAAQKTPDERRAAAYPYAGSDESGKGDTFGPLVVAACSVDAREEQLLVTLGVRDSKVIGDTEIGSLSQTIRQTIPHGISMRVLEPNAYNDAMSRVRARGGNLNTLLGILHGECISELAASRPLAWAIADRFGDEKFLRKELPAGLAFCIEARAETYPAVAAASILARQACLDWFTQGAGRDFKLPRGSSDPRIVPLLKSIYSQHGRETLCGVAKAHFQSVQDVLSAADNS